MDIFKKYPNQLNLLAVFSADDLKEDWLKDNEEVERNYLTTHFPIEYKKAVTVIGNDKDNRKQRTNYAK